MSDYENSKHFDSDENFDDIIAEKQEQIKARRGRKPGGKNAIKETEEEIIRIKEFDLNSMPPYSVNDDKNGIKIVVIGKPGTGKSTIIQDIVASKSHIAAVAQIFSGTEDSNHYYSENFHPAVSSINSTWTLSKILKSDRKLLKNIFLILGLFKSLMTALTILPF